MEKKPTAIVKCYSQSREMLFLSSSKEKWWQIAPERKKTPAAGKHYGCKRRRIFRETGKVNFCTGTGQKAFFRIFFGLILDPPPGTHASTAKKGKFICTGHFFPHCMAFLEKRGDWYRYTFFLFPVEKKVLLGGRKQPKLTKNQLGNPSSDQCPQDSFSLCILRDVRAVRETHCRRTYQSREYMTGASPALCSKSW